MNVKAIDMIRDIDHNGLDESEAEILREAVHAIKIARRKRFDRCLERASEIVAGWPEWKREVAGQVMNGR